MGKIYISKNAYDETLDFFPSKVIFEGEKGYEAIRNHPDIYMCQLGDEMFYGDPELIGDRYPLDIRYNACCTGKYFIHNLKYTDKELLKCAEKYIKVDVPQGYTKCNVLVVDEDTIITSDRGIKHDGLNITYIRPGHILLPGQNYGFIGGASGLVEDTIYFNGDITLHPDYQIIRDTILSRGKKIEYVRNKPLLDIGSILEDRSK
ncbi:MAG: hypothetical protein MJ146_00640 [Clostridia bacterium]|nr:hypothetical protein [Clostridia bacterium]